MPQVQPIRAFAKPLQGTKAKKSGSRPVALTALSPDHHKRRCDDGNHREHARECVRLIDIDRNDDDHRQTYPRTHRPEPPRCRRKHRRPNRNGGPDSELTHSSREQVERRCRVGLGQYD